MRQFTLIILSVFSLGCHSDKGDLEFYPDGIKRVRAFKVEVKPTYESLKKVLIERSCLKCHNPDSDPDTQAPDIPLDTYDALIVESDNVLFTLSPECAEEEICMPERDENGRFKMPAPSEEVIQAFKDWIEQDFPE